MNKYLLLSLLLLVPQVGFAVKIIIVNDTESEVEVPNDEKCGCRENCGHEILSLDTIQSNETKTVSMSQRQAKMLNDYFKDNYPKIGVLGNSCEPNKLYLTKHSLNQ